MGMSRTSRWLLGAALVAGAAANARAAISSARPTVAILPFENLSGESWTVRMQLGGGRDERQTTGTDRYAARCRNLIEDHLTSSRDVAVLDRSSLDRALEEKVFQGTEYASKAGWQDLGSTLGAQMLLQGTILPTVARFEVEQVGRQDRTTIFIDTTVRIKITAVETGTVLFVESYPGRSKHVGLAKLGPIQDDVWRELVIARKGESSLTSTSFAGGDLLLKAIDHAIRAATADPRWVQVVAGGPPRVIPAVGVTVLPFSNGSGISGRLNQEQWSRDGRVEHVPLDKYAIMARLAAEEIVVDFCSAPVADRDQIDRSVIQELEFSSSGMVSQQSAIQLGKMVGAKLLVLGSIEAANVRTDPAYDGPQGWIKNRVETGLRIRMIDADSSIVEHSRTYAGAAEYVGPARDFLSDGFLMVWALKDAIRSAGEDPRLRDLLINGPGG